MQTQFKIEPSNNFIKIPSTKYRYFRVLKLGQLGDVLHVVIDIIKQFSKLNH